MTRVLKLGGRTQASPELVAAVAAEWARGRRDMCIVHGGGDEISALQRALGFEPAFVGGRRVTTEGDVDLVRMALSGAANKRLVAAFTAADVRAWGISGEDAELITAEAVSSELGRAGRPSSVDPTAIVLLLERGYLPVVSPLGRDGSGAGALNVNGDDAAAALAAALEASELVFVSDVAGVADASGAVINSLTIADARELVSAGVATAGMAAKLEAAERALVGGVARVRIAGISGVRDPSAGTVFTSAAREALV